MDTVIARKLVNALIANAEMGFAAKFLLDKAGLGATEVVLEGFKKAMGGLWVGGSATLKQTEICFRPNALNRAVHTGDYTIVIPLTEISTVDVRFGFVTKIIDIRTAHGTLSIRCYGASAFADKIRAQRELQLKNG